MFVLVMSGTSFHFPNFLGTAMLKLFISVYYLDAKEITSPDPNDSIYAHDTLKVHHVDHIDTNTAQNCTSTGKVNFKHLFFVVNNGPIFSYPLLKLFLE